MDLEKLYFLSQIAAAVAIFASLIFVGLQLRQGNRESRLASSQAVDNSLMSSFDPIYIPENSRVWTKGHATPDALDGHESEIFAMLMIRAFQSFNMVASHHARGTYDDELFQPVAWYFASLLVTEGGKHWKQKNWKILPTYPKEVLEKHQNLIIEQNANVA